MGSRSGLRVVLGEWRQSPFGAFADVMLESGAGHRVLIAPSDEIARFVRETYSFDEVVLAPVVVDPPGPASPGPRRVRAGDLDLTVVVGPRTMLGRLLRLVPGPLARHPVWIRAIDPVARVVQRGVRTTGSAGNGRREFYGATDQFSVLSVAGTWRGTPLGELRPVEPPVRFGFGSTPPTPSAVRVTTTVRLPPGGGSA